MASHFFYCFPLGGSNDEDKAATTIAKYARGKNARKRAEAMGTASTQLKKKDNALLSSPRDIKATEQGLEYAKPKPGAPMEQITYDEVDEVKGEGKVIVIVLKDGKKPVIFRAATPHQAVSFRKALQTLCGDAKTPTSPGAAA